MISCLILFCSIAISRSMRLVGCVDTVAHQRFQLRLVFRCDLANARRLFFA